jgi:uroporphyrinogen-III decarboxylase
MGNLDPALLLLDTAKGSVGQATLRAAVRACIGDGGVFGNQRVQEGDTLGMLRKNHVLNLGHGVEQTTSEDAVRILVDESRKC